MWERLYSKNGLAAKKIAELLNKIDVGARCHEFQITAKD